MSRYDLLQYKLKVFCPLYPFLPYKFLIPCREDTYKKEMWSYFCLWQISGSGPQRNITIWSIVNVHMSIWTATIIAIWQEGWLYCRGHKGPLWRERCWYISRCSPRIGCKLGHGGEASVQIFHAPFKVMNLWALTGRNRDRGRREPYAIKGCDACDVKILQEIADLYSSCYLHVILMHCTLVLFAFTT
jgi:hypothetical protein